MPTAKMLCSGHLASTLCSSVFRAARTPLGGYGTGGRYASIEFPCPVSLYEICRQNPKILTSVDNFRTSLSPRGIRFRFSPLASRKAGKLLWALGTTILQTRARRGGKKCPKTSGFGPYCRRLGLKYNIIFFWQTDNQPRK